MMNKCPIFRFSYTDYTAIRTHLQKAGEDESLLFALFSKAVVEDHVIYLCSRLLLPDHRQLQNQTCVSIEPSREYQAIAYGLAYELGLSIADIHTHPFTRQARFSPIDDYHGTQNAEYIARHFPDDCSMGMIVFGKGFDNFEAGVWNREEAAFEPVRRIEIVGSPTFVLTETRDCPIDLKEDIYARHRLIPGWKQGLIEDLKVFVCGLGGNGALIFDSLLALGVGKRNGWLKACDPDVLEASNIPRIPYAYPDRIGQNKAVVAQMHADRKAASSNVTCYPESIDSETMQNCVKEANIVFGAIDNDGARLVLNQLAARYLVPYIDLGTEILSEDAACQSVGQVQVFIPGKTACLLCSGAIDPSKAALDSMTREDQVDYERAGYLRGTPETPTPSVLHLNGVVSHLAISQMLRMIFSDGFEGKEYLHYDRQKTFLLAASTLQDDECPVCGLKGYLGNGDEDSGVLDELSELKDNSAFENSRADAPETKSQPSAVLEN